MFNLFELIYDSSLVLDCNGLLFYWPISIVSWSSYIRYDITFPVPPWDNQNQPCHDYTSMNTKSNDADPFHMIVNCCVVCDLAKLVRVCHIWPTACFTVRPGVYPNLTYQVDCCVDIDLLFIEDSQPSFCAPSSQVLTSFIAVYCRMIWWGTIQCYTWSISPTKMWCKSWFVHRK